MALEQRKEPTRVLGLELAPIKIPMNRRMQTFAVFLYMSLFLGMALCTVTVLWSLLFTSLSWITFLYVSWMIYDRNIGNIGGRKNCWIRKWFLWKHFRDFFPIKLVKTAELDPNQTYLIGAHPHGILCYGAFCAFATDALNVQEVFPGIFPRLLTLKQQFLLPGSRELVSGTGACAATKEGMEAVLREPKGVAAVLIVGGASEALNYADTEIKLVLNRRKGFVKLALRYGRPLVPCFTFGENFIYGQAPNPEGSRLRRFQNWFEKNFSFSLPIFYGRGIFQYNWGIVPFRKPLTVVVGKPIPVTKNANPTYEDIQNLHTTYVEALTKLYEEYNPIYGDKKVKLVIG